MPQAVAVAAAADAADDDDAAETPFTFVGGYNAYWYNNVH